MPNTLVHFVEPDSGYHVLGLVLAPPPLPQRVSWILVCDADGEFYYPDGSTEWLPFPSHRAREARTRVAARLGTSKIKRKLADLARFQSGPRLSHLRAERARDQEARTEWEALCGKHSTHRFGRGQLEPGDIPDRMCAGSRRLGYSSALAPELERYIVHGINRVQRSQFYTAVSSLPTMEQQVYRRVMLGREPWNLGGQIVTCAMRPAQAAEYFGVTRQTIYTYLQRGHFHIMRRLTFDPWEQTNPLPIHDDDDVEMKTA
jgi:hypothetical protein